MTLLDFYDNLTCSANEESDTNDAEDENLPSANPSSSVQTTSSGRDLPAVAADHGDQLAIAVKKAKKGTVLKASRAKSLATEKENLPIRKSRRKCSVQTTSSDPDLPAVGVVQLAISSVLNSGHLMGSLQLDLHQYYLPLQLVILCHGQQLQQLQVTRYYF